VNRIEKELLEARINSVFDNYPDPETLHQRLERIVRISPGCVHIFADGENEHRRAFFAFLTLGDAAIDEIVRRPYLLTTVLNIVEAPDPFHNNPSPENNLALYKRIVWLKILLRDRLGLVGLEQTNADLSKLADFVSKQAFKAIGYDSPPLALFAMGKWGGQELNASSDIDPVFFAKNEKESMDGDGIVRKWSHKLAGESGDAIYPVDLRLRPEGRSGPYVCSVQEAERYFFQRAASWERIAYLRARHVTGEIQGWFFDLIDNFLFGMLNDPRKRIREVADALRSIRKSAGKRDVKRGEGGIRDCEFLVVSFQLSEGRSRPELRQGTVIDLLKVLGKSGSLDAKQSEDLIDSYSFLRRIENSLQAEEDRAKFVVPKPGSRAHGRLAFSMNLSPGTFEVTLKMHRARIRNYVNFLLMESVSKKSFQSTLIDPQLEIDELSSLEKKGKSQQVLRRLSGSWGNAARLFDPTVFSGQADNKDALIRLESAVSSYGGPESWLKAFGKKEKLLKELSLLILFGKRAVDEANQRPYLWERIGLESLNNNIQSNEKSAISNRLGDILFHLAEKFISEKINSTQLTGEWSVAVDTLIKKVATHLLSDPLKVSVLAMGKWGGSELAPDADLDVVLISENGQASDVAKSVQNGMKWLQEASLNGRMMLDARLRPEGSGAPMVITLSRLEEYLTTRAQAWEKMALVRTRWVAGDSGVGKQASNIIRAFTTQKPEAKDVQKIDKARKKAALESKARKGVVRIKKAKGGMMDFEFASTYAAWNMELDSTLSFWNEPIAKRLAKLGDMSGESIWFDAQRAYEELRRWELIQLFSSSLRKGDIPLKGENSEKFAAASGIKRENIEKEWEKIAKIGRRVYDLSMKSLMEVD